VTIMLMDAGLDTGPMLAARRTPVHDDDTGGALTERLSHIGAELLVETLSAFAAGDLAPRAQPDEGVSLAPKITADDRALDPLKPARLVARQIQALSPHIGVTAQIDGRPFKLWSARVSDAEPPAAGTMATHEGRLVLGCGAGAVEILRLQPPGRGPLAAADFLRGWRGDLALQPRDG
jgi:methionyl-tRNA formyltransferase